VAVFTPTVSSEYHATVLAISYHFELAPLCASQKIS